MTFFYGPKCDPPKVSSTCWYIIVLTAVCFRTMRYMGGILNSCDFFFIFYFIPVNTLEYFKKRQQDRDFFLSIISYTVSKSDIRYSASAERMRNIAGQLYGQH